MSARARLPGRVSSAARSGADARAKPRRFVRRPAARPLSALAAAAFASLAGAALATHTSKPILATEATWHTGAMVQVRGRVEYAGAPAAGVLVEVRLRRGPAEPVLASARARSRADGTFALELAAPRESGAYVLEAVSHCSDEHRHLCTFQREAMPVTVRPAQLR